MLYALHHRADEDILVRLHAPDSVDLDHTDQFFVSFSQEFINEVTSPLWHANGTIKMSPLSDPTAASTTSSASTA